MLGAVAVVHVPVDDRHARHAAGHACVLHRDRDVGEDAEPLPGITLGVMAGRPDERVRVVDLAVEHRVHSGDAAAGGQQRDLVRAVAERREVAGVAAERVALALDAGDVLGRVQAQDLLFGRRARLEQQQVVDEAADLDQVLDPALALRALDVGQRLHRETGGHDPGRRAGVVPHVQLVPDQACGHSSFSTSCGAVGLTSTCTGAPSGARYLSYRRRTTGHRPCGANTAMPAMIRPSRSSR